MTTVNVAIEISGPEERRIVRRYLSKEFYLDYKWEGDDAVEYEDHYHGSGVHRRVVKKITPIMRKAKEVHDLIRKD